MEIIRRPFSIIFGETSSMKEWIVMTIRLDLFNKFGISKPEIQELKRKELSLFGKNVLKNKKPNN